MSTLLVATNLSLDEATLTILKAEAKKAHLSMSAVLRILAKRLRDGEVRLL